MVWLAWDSSHWQARPKNAKWRSSAPSAGAHMYAITARGARFLLNERVKENFWEGHMGTKLAEILEKYQEGFGDEFGCCYLNPPVGNYISHETTTNANIRVLPSHFAESWCQGGTRATALTKKDLWWDRQLCHLTESGPPKVIAEVKPEENSTDRWWTTQAPASFPEDGLGVRFWHEAESPILDRPNAWSE